MNPRKVMLVTAAAAVLGAGGAGAAYATSGGAGTSETGYAVVSTTDETAPGGTSTAPSDPAGPKDEGCDEYGAGRGDGDRGASPSQPPSTSPSSPSQSPQSPESPESSEAAGVRL